MTDAWRLSKAAREAIALRALAHTSGGDVLVEAHTVAARARYDEDGDRSITPQGIGQVLSRLADEGRCEKVWCGWLHVYRSS